MPDITLTISVTDAQHAILTKIATAKRATVPALLAPAALGHAQSIVASFRQDVINRIPELLNKASDEEQSELLAKFEEISARS